MNVDKAKLLFRLEGSKNSESKDLARVFLASAHLEPHSQLPGRISAAEAIRIWRTRSNNVKYTEKCIRGVELLLKRLEALDPNDELEQYSFTGSEFSGNLFFATKSQEFVGLVFVVANSAGKEVGTSVNLD